jgi:hypothetical protein
MELLTALLLLGLIQCICLVLAYTLDLVFK